MDDTTSWVQTLLQSNKSQSQLKHQPALDPPSPKTNHHNNRSNVLNQKLPLIYPQPYKHHTGKPTPKEPVVYKPATQNHIHTQVSQPPNHHSLQTKHRVYRGRGVMYLPKIWQSHFFSQHDCHSDIISFINDSTQVVYLRQASYCAFVFEAST